MCSICRNPNCQYSFSKQQWKPGEDLLVVELPESDLLFFKQVRIVEEMMVRPMTGVNLLPCASEPVSATTSSAVAGSQTACSASSSPTKAGGA